MNISKKQVAIFHKEDTLHLWLNNHYAIIYYLYNYVGEYQAAREWADSIISHPFNKPRTSLDFRYQGQILNFTGAMYQDLENYDKAEELFFLAENHFEKAGMSPEMIQSRIYRALGFMYISRWEPTKAIYYFENYISASYKLEKWDDVVNGYTGLAVVFYNLKEPEKELATYRKGLNVKQASSEAYTGIYFSMGDAYRGLEKFDSALLVTDYAIKKYTQAFKEKRTQILLSNQVRAMTLKGAIYLDMKEYEKGRNNTFKSRRGYT